MTDEVSLAYTDDPRLRGLKGRWMERIALEREQARILAEEAMRYIDETPAEEPKPGSLPGDKLRLRGIPCLVEQGLGGEIRYTRPGNAKSLEKIDRTSRGGLSVEARFWQRVQKGESCWLWVGHKNRAGYGIFNIDGRRILAHRYSWVLAFGNLGEKIIHHVCEVKHCVQPAHLLLTDGQEHSQHYHVMTPWEREEGWRAAADVCAKMLDQVEEPQET